MNHRLYRILSGEMRGINYTHSILLLNIWNTHFQLPIISNGKIIEMKPWVQIHN